VLKAGAVHAVSHGEGRTNAPHSEVPELWGEIRPLQSAYRSRAWIHAGCRTQGEAFHSCTLTLAPGTLGEYVAWVH
jgi:hypothetical protein